MLVVKAGGTLIKFLKKAEETGTLHRLIEQLEFLDNFAGRDKTLVELVEDIPPCDVVLLWRAIRNTKGALEGSIANGGLVFHENTKEWGIHG